MTSLDEACFPENCRCSKLSCPFFLLLPRKCLHLHQGQSSEYHCYFNSIHLIQKSLDGGNLMEFMKGIVPPEEQAQMEQFADMFEHMDLYQEMFEGFAPKEGDT